MDKIEELLNDKATNLQRRALTDTSYKNINHALSDDTTNFELATYGDAVLKLALCEIYLNKKKADNFGFKGKLTEWKKQYESDEVLVRIVAKHYNLLNFLKYDEKGNGIPEEQKPRDYDHKGQDDNDRHKYIATAIEVCIAVVYIENGENEVLKIIEKWIQWIDEEENSSNP